MAEWRMRRGSLSLGEVLALETFVRGRSELVAGAEGASTRVVGMVASDNPHVGPGFRPGCLCLTSASLLASEMRQRLLVHELAEAGAAGLVIRLASQGVADLPGPLLEEALQRHLPIVTIAREVRPSEIIDQLECALMRVDLRLLDEADKIGRCFNRMVLQGATLDDLLSDLSEDLDHPVVLEDVAHQVVAFARRTADASAADDWETHSRNGHDDAGPGAVRRSAGGSGCLWTDLRIRGATWGRLHVLRAGREFDDMNVLVADRGATAVSMLLLAQSSMEKVVVGEKNSLMTNFIHNHVSPEEFAKRLEAMSVGTSGRQLGVIAFRLRGSVRRGQVLHPRQARTTMDAVLAELSTAMADTACKGFSALAQDMVYGIIAAGDSARLEQMSCYVSDLVIKRAAAKDLDLVAGMSTAVTRSSLRRAVWEADQAVEYAMSSAGSEATCRFRELGVQNLLMNLGDGPELASFVEAELGALLAFDANAKTPLMPTLEAYLASGAQKLPTARGLHIDRRTLYQRLGKIEEILGAGRLGREADRVRIWLAIQGLRVLSRRSGPGPRT